MMGNVMRGCERMPKYGIMGECGRNGEFGLTRKRT